jgi:methyl-accepting chemotaxis protein
MSDMQLPADLPARPKAAEPRLAMLVAASSERLALTRQSARSSKRLERLMIAARTLGAERRLGPRMPFSQRVTLQVGSAAHATTSIDIGRRGIMLARPLSLGQVSNVSACVGIHDVGMFPARLVALDAQTLSLAFQPCEGNPAHDGLMRLITALEAQNADAIAVSVAFARDIADAFAAAVDTHRITVAELFASELKRIAGTDPPQFDHPAMPLFETVLPQLMAWRYQPEAGIAYAVATTRTCFVPIHHADVSQPQRAADPCFNHAFSRHRRIYDDRWTLRAAAFSQFPVVQAYRRDIPSGPGALVRDVSAPIFVGKRHWGAAQIGYLMPDKPQG